MVTLKTLDSSIVSFIILGIILIHSYNRLERIFTQYKLFIAMVILNMAMIVIDILGWAFNGLPGPSNYLFNAGANTVLYITAPLLPSVWVLYTNSLAHNDPEKLRRLKSALMILLSANALMALVSLHTGWYFYVDSTNIYHRGPLFAVHVCFNILLMLHSFIFVVSNRKHFEAKQFNSVMLFFVAPLTGMALQVLNYGVSYNWTGTAISLLIIYFNLQSRNLSTDYLTGVNNRLHFHVFLKEKIRSSAEDRTFGAIMIDVDRFKSINDHFGHATGDQALKDTVQILRNALRKDDFIARFGGDEFLVLVDAQSPATLQNTIGRIRESIESFNGQGTRPYKLSFSFGYALYDVRQRMKPDEFLDHLDRLMYEDKGTKQAIGR